MKNLCLVATLACAGLLCLPDSARATGGNLDFDEFSARPDGTNAPADWSVTLTPPDDLTLASQDILPSYAGNTNVLQIAAANSYSWSDASGWTLDQNDISQASVFQFFMTVPVGTSALEFRAAAEYAGATVYGLSPSGMPAAAVSVVYLQEGVGPTTATLVISDSQWTDLRRVELPGLDPSQPVIVMMQVSSGLSDLEPSPQSGQFETNVSVAGYFDDFQFAVVPEPLTCAAVALGVLALAAYLRRRPRLT